MYIAKMTIKDAPPFSEEVDFKFDKRVNVFIGPNASGKSTLLRHIFETLKREWDGSDNQHLRMASDFDIICGNPVKIHESVRVTFVSDHDEQQNKWDVITIPALRIGHGYKESNGKCIMNSEDHDYYGVGDLERKYVERAVYLLVEETRSTDRPSKRVNLAKARDISFLCAKNIGREIVEGSAPLNMVTGGRDLHDDLFATLPEVRVAMGIDTIDCDPQGDSLPMHWLSSGVQDSLLWIRFLALKMLHHYDFADGWEKKPAILLIDEIENHLHPTWQRRVISALLEHFPGLQIFATTHSPFRGGRVEGGAGAFDESGQKRRSQHHHQSTPTSSRGGRRMRSCAYIMGVGEPTDEHYGSSRGGQLRRLRDEGDAGGRARGGCSDRREIREAAGKVVNIATLLDGPRAAEDARFTC